MDTQTYFAYAAGTPEQISNGNLDEIPNSRSIGDLRKHLVPTRGKLILPVFIGVYQRKTAMNHSPDERPLIEEWERKIQIGENMSASLARTSLFSTSGKADYLNPSLISVLYNAAVWSKGSVRELVRDSAGRVAINPVTKAPDFYEKNPQAMNVILEDELSRIMKGEEKLDILKSMAARIDMSARELVPYGLTTQEYAIWRLHEEARNFYPDSPIISSNPQLEADPMVIAQGKLLVEESRTNRNILETISKLFGF